MTPSAQTLNTMRQRFWIPQGRAIVLRTINRHYTGYRRWHARPFLLQTFPPVRATGTVSYKPLADV
uniref:Integrase n=1 Tax=Ascaris lumbricoides TaxID=6252 RepID=A0A0M3II94_ASCLU